MPEVDSSLDDYALLDSGDGAKLERFGSQVLQRPSPQALWPRTRPASAWDGAAAIYHRRPDGGGHWEHRRPLPDGWPLRWGGLRLVMKPTGFGHLGVFPEQVPFWDWIRRTCANAAGEMTVLNLFGYTGGSTLSAAAHARVTHLDASKGVVDWARENAVASDLSDAPVRWIVDDANVFVRREGRRDRRYRGLVLDPPSFGRGPKGQVWKLERDLLPLLQACAELMADDAEFVLLSAHTPGVGPQALANLLAGALNAPAHELRCGEMVIHPEAAGLSLPSGSWATWSRGDGPVLAPPPRSPAAADGPGP